MKSMQKIARQQIQSTVTTVWLFEICKKKTNVKVINSSEVSVNIFYKCYLDSQIKDNL